MELELATEGKKTPGVDVTDKRTPAALDLICWSTGDRQAEFPLEQNPRI